MVRAFCSPSALLASLHRIPDWNSPLTLVLFGDAANAQEAYRAAYAANKAIATKPLQPRRSSLSSAAINASVSVVIPTRNRPQMVLAAVRSALSQTLAPGEVIVVIDGPAALDAAGPQPAADDGTEAALAQVADKRLRILALPSQVGGAEARNTGVRAATGHWIAFLDDDDLWLPGKLAVQLGFAAALPADITPVLSCPVLARSPQWEESWPRTAYHPGELMAEYLFCRRGWRYGSALLQTSTLLAPRELLLRVPFTLGLRKHQDWDWLLRATAEPDVAVYPVGKVPLAIFHVEGERSSVGRACDWRFSLAWASQRQSYFTPRAFAGFLVTECAAQAGAQGWRDRLAFVAALLRAEPRLMPAQLLQLTVFLLLSQKVRRAIRTVLQTVRLARQGTPATCRAPACRIR